MSIMDINFNCINAIVLKKRNLLNKSLKLLLLIPQPSNH